MPGPEPIPLEVRLWAGINKDGPSQPHMDTPCFVWTKARSSSGYGIIAATNGGVRTTPLVHRVSWEIHNGPIQQGLIVCHRCDNPLCVRPEHLFLGTDKDNVADALAKGRRPRANPGPIKRGGRRQPRPRRPPRPLSALRTRAKLTVEQVREIRRLYEAGEANQPQLGRMYGLRKDAISKIIRRVRWLDV